MVETGDLIDFDVIETHKENIQSLPGGRSAKSLSLLCSPISIEKAATFTDTQNLKQSIRQEYEKELLTISEADDPLDIYDRYIKWTLDAYPSAQATAQSGLLPLLERATKSFLTTAHYKNDARYLKIWLLYIKLFADSPRETYAFLARHGVGESLALFYEEFAAWLEGAGRWAQAEEVFAAGLDKEARPTERLLRKFAEFQHRRDTKAQQDGDGPTSPALPKVRPALAAKVDPFTAAASPTPSDPQARDRAAAARPGRPNKSKLAIFADVEEEQPKALGAGGPKGWENIGSHADRRKENAREAKPWAGEKLAGGKKLGGPKMMVFKDESSAMSNAHASISPEDLRREVINPKTGRAERVFVDLESVYPTGDDRTGVEFCFEELRARHRGWLDKDWSKLRRTNPQKPPIPVDDLQRPRSSTTELQLLQEEPVALVVETPKSVPLNDSRDDEENRVAAAAKAAKKAKKEDRANRTRKICVMEVRAETQTVQTNLDSPSGPKLKRKKSAEPTMTFHTKEAMNEVYDIFNQPLKCAENQEGNVSEDESDDDDYTSAGESTGTGRISGATSEYGDEVDGEYTEKTTLDPTVGNTTNVSGWSEFTAVKPGEHEDLSAGEDEDSHDEDDELHTVDTLVTPTEPGLQSPFAGGDEEPEDDRLEPKQTSYRPFPSKGSRLPFMTPIVEKTESSVGAMTHIADKEFHALKTPSRQNNARGLGIEEPWSSPFDDVTDDGNKNALISPPTPPRLVKSQQMAPAADKVSCSQPKEVQKDKLLKGPIIKDAQCNPIDDVIRRTILDQIQPPLKTYNGFFDRRGTTSGRSADIRKYTKALSKTGKGDKTATSITMPPTIDLEAAARRHTVKRELGRGAFAPVYLVESMAPSDDGDDKPVKMGEGDFAVRRGAQEAIKMEDPPSAWEFYMIRQAKRRLGVSRPSESIVDVYEMHLFDDDGFMIEEYRNQGTLLDLVNICRADGNSGGAMDELLAMFFTVELFRTVEALHSKGLIHGDLKADNILVRFDHAATEGSWTSQYCRNGRSGWSGKGVTLIDFGRGIDMRVFKPDVQFIADWKTSEADCAEMREMRPWTFQVDYHGLAGTIHSLLFGKYLETVAERGAILGAGATKTYRIRETLKRYWQTEIWSDVFDLLLNPLQHLEGEDGKKLPILNGMKTLRERMEVYLETNCEKGVGLKSLIRRMEVAIKERRK